VGLTATAAAALSWHGLTAHHVPARPRHRPAERGQVDMVAASRPLVTKIRKASTGAIVIVRSGDTLSGIAGSMCGDPARYPQLAAGNHIADPDLITPGESIRPTCEAPVPVQHAAPAAPAAPAAAPEAAPAAHSDAVTATGGIYSCGALEGLWEQAGGSAGLAVTMAGIAMAESGGNPGAVSPTDDFGLWQDHADPAALNPSASAAASVSIEASQGLGAWTTYRTGAYAGRC
jgi:nucleoid-associated protein YgaU